MKTTNKLVRVNHAINYRNYRRARDRALSRLANAYPETYKELLEQEKVNDETTAGQWVPIGDNVNVTVEVRASDGVKDTGGSTSGYSEDEGDEGGEA
jgi:hypothetical protein